MDLTRVATGLMEKDISVEEKKLIEVISDSVRNITEVVTQQNGEQLYIKFEDNIPLLFSILNTKLYKYRFRVHEIDGGRMWIISDKEISRRSAERED